MTSAASIATTTMEPVAKQSVLLLSTGYSNHVPMVIGYNGKWHLKNSLIFYSMWQRKYFRRSERWYQLLLRSQHRSWFVLCGDIEWRNVGIRWKISKSTGKFQMNWLKSRHRLFLIITFGIKIFLDEQGSRLQINKCWRIVFRFWSWWM